MVSSLSGGANGSDACGAWDARLRAARALLRATHHAQRRYLLTKLPLDALKVKRRINYHTDEFDGLMVIK